MNCNNLIKIVDIENVVIDACIIQHILYLSITYDTINK